MMFFGFLLKDNTYIDGFKKVQRECTFSAFDRDRKEIYIKFIYRLFPVVDLEFPFSHYFYGFFFMSKLILERMWEDAACLD